MRLLVIAAHADHRMLVKKHAEIEWPDVVIINTASAKMPN